MATDLSPAVAPSVSDEEHIQEASLRSSLARLQEMHIALRHLRNTIPRVVSSIQSADSTSEPAELYAQFSNAAGRAGKDIQGFMHMMSDEQAKEIFGQVRKSKEADGEGIEGWKVTEHEDWLDVRKEVKAEELASDVEEPQRVDGGRPEDREKIIESFRATHSGVEVDLSDPIMVKLPSPVDINFSIAYTGDNSRGRNWEVAGITNRKMKETKLTKSILGTILASGRRFRDLGSILELVAAYSDVTTRPCTKCTRPIDRTGQLPIVRSRKRTKLPDGQYTTEWLAFHQACI